MNREDKFALLDRLTAAKGSAVSPMQFILRDDEVDWLRLLVTCELFRETVLR